MLKGTGQQVVGQAARAAVLIGAAALVYSFVATARDGEARRRCGAFCAMQPSYAGAERRLPQFDVLDLAGRTRRSAEWAGKVVVLNFWTKTCGPCLEEMPSFDHLARTLQGDRGVVVAAISLDEGVRDVADAITDVLRAPPAFEALVDSGGEVITGKFGTDLFPETWIIDAQGVIRARFDGPRDWSDPVVAELVREIEGGVYCPVTIRGGRSIVDGDDGITCESVNDG